MSTTAYPPSIGGVQSVVEELRLRLVRFEADIAALWFQNRTDWLTGTTLRLGRNENMERAPGLTAIGWDAGTRMRMAPWVLSYYMYPKIAARQIAAQLVPSLDAVVRADHVLIHAHRIGREFLAHASLLIARRRGIPFVLSPYHHARWRGFRYEGWNEVYRAADAMLTLTHAEAEELRALGVRAERIHVVGCAADPPIPADTNRFRGLLGGAMEPIILFLGQQYEYKGVVELVSAVDALHARGVQARLVFIGPATPFSRRFFAQHTRPWLHVLGTVDEQTKWDAIEACAVTCLPSRQESFGRVFLEAWSKTKPVIGARIPSVSEVVTDGKTGLLVDPGSADQLARALERVIGDSNLAGALGRSGELEVNSRFSWKEVIGRTEAVYESLLKAVVKT